MVSQRVVSHCCRKSGRCVRSSSKRQRPKREALFLASFKDTRERYQTALASAWASGRHQSRQHRTSIPASRARHGDYALADETYADLLDRLAERHFADAPPALRQNIPAYCAAAPDKISGKKERKRMKRIREQLSSLKAQVSRLRDSET